MNVNQINTSMANIIGQYQSATKTQTDKNSKTNSAKTNSKEVTEEKVGKSANLGKTIGEPKLSEKAAEYYNKLKEKFHNMDFILVSEDQKEAAKARASSYGNASKMVVLIDEEKLERMATDAEYRAKYEGIIGNAASNLAQVSSKLSSTGANVAGFGMQVKDDGTVSYFAVLKKSSDAQKERIQESREKKAEAKKAEAKKAEAKKAEKKLKEKRAEDAKEKGKTENGKTEKVKVEADSIEDLIEKVRNQYQTWQIDNVMTEEERAIGQHIDFAG